MNIKSPLTILAIETSCDETAAAVIEAKETAEDFELQVLSNAVASQIEIHKKWGGVYPELASRAHLEAMIPVLEEALETVSGIEGPSLDAIAVTVGPGLIGSLLMGVETAQILAAYFKKPVIPVNHLEGHIYAGFADKIENSMKIAPQGRAQRENWKLKIAKTGIFPILALIVSGGHTSLVLMEKHLKYRTIGQTLDDAAGEAFDKVARILGLGYPGGPMIEKLAQKGNENAYKLPLSMVKQDNYDFSFSGLKTAVLYTTKNPTTGKTKKYNKADLAASFQKTVSQILTQKTIRAVKDYKPKTVILSGGVSANSHLRSLFAKELGQMTKAQILIPPKNLSTDNAVGIGLAAALKLFKNKKTSWGKIKAQDNFPIDKS